MDRRNFLQKFAGAATASGGVLFFGKAFGAQAPVRCAPAAPGSGASPLFLPTSGGQAAGQVFADTPDWFRDEPGIYVGPETNDAGAGLLSFPDQGATVINDFTDHSKLLELFQQAQSIGLNIVYLTAWYEPRTEGDYVAKPGLQGAIAALQAAGGRVILRIEGLLVRTTSAIAQATVGGVANGAAWSILTPDLQPISLGPGGWYPGYYKMCPFAQGWMDCLTNFAIRLAGYGADGIYFDDWGDPPPAPPATEACFGSHAQGHNHLPDPDVSTPNAFNRGQVALARRVRTAIRNARPDGMVMITEGAADQRHGLLQYIDGCLGWNPESFVADWLWDAQGDTDTFVPGYSIDVWHQILAIGAKLACPYEYLQPPPGGSAAEFLNGELARKPSDVTASTVKQFTKAVLWGLNRWRNAGLLLGVQMPSFADLMPLPVLSPSDQLDLLASLATRASQIDCALAGMPLPPIAPYLKRLLDARRQLCQVIDHGASVERVGGHAASVGWRFSGPGGNALTAVNVGDAPATVVFDRCFGLWREYVAGTTATAVRGILQVRVPGHAVCMLRQVAPFVPPPPNPIHSPGHTSTRQ